MAPGSSLVGYVFFSLVFFLLFLLLLLLVVFFVTVIIETTVQAVKMSHFLTIEGRIS